VGHDQLEPRAAAGAGVPEMWLMEAVLSSTMCHPNVVQVYTYTMEPLGAVGGTALVHGSEGLGSGQDSGSDRDEQQQQQQELGTVWDKGAMSRARQVTGWQLSIIMEYCTAVSEGCGTG
jgi:hypothetical protein